MKIVVVKESVISRDGGRKTFSTLTACVKPSDPRECKELIPQGYFKGIGVAKCDPEDEVDEKIGYRISRSRAYKNLYREVLAAYREKLDQFKKNIEITKTSINKYKNAIDAQDRDIYRVINGSDLSEISMDPLSIDIDFNI